MAGSKWPQRWAGAKPPVGTPLDGAHPLTRGLAGFWPLDDGGGLSVREASGRLAPGTISGPTWTAAQPGTVLTYTATGQTVTLKAGALLYNLAPEASVGAWIYRSSLPSAERAVYSEDVANGTVFGLRITAANAMSVQVKQSNNTFVAATSSSTLVAGAWHHVVCTLSARAAALAVYVDGVLAGPAGAWNGTFLGTAIVSSSLGAYPVNGAGFSWGPNGQIAHLGLWTRVLGADEIGQLWLNPLGLYAPARRLWLMPRTQGPTLAAATLTPSGASTRTPARTSAGSSTPAGALGRTPSHPTAGSMTPAGALARLCALARVGSSTLAGAIRRTPSHQETGSSTPSGTLARTPAHGATGSSTPAGDLTRTPLVALTGALGAGAGTLARTITGGGAAALATSGALARAIAAPADAALAATGVLARTCSAPLSGATLAAAGTLGRVAQVARGATMTLAGGALGRRITQAAAASALLGGALVRAARRPQAGTLTPVGALARTAALVRAGTVPLRGRYVGIFRVVRRATLALRARLALLLAPLRAGGQTAALVLPARTHAVARADDQAPRPAALAAPARARALTLSPHRTVPMQLVPSDADPDAPLVIAPLERNIAFTADFSADIPAGRQIASVATQVVRLDDPTQADLSSDFVATTTRTNSNRSIEVIVGNGAQQERAVYRVRIIATLDNSPATDLVGYFDLPCRE